jgi:hypothetical protein
MTHVKQLGVTMAAALVVLGGAMAVQAQVIFSDQAAFLAQVGSGYYLETFDEVPQFTVVPAPLAFSTGGFSYTASTEPILQDFFPAGPPGDTWLSTNAPSDDIVFDFTSGNVTAVGGFFFRTDPAGEVATAGTVTLTLDNGTVYSVDAPSANTFVGFTTSSPILSLSVGVEPVGGFLEDFATANDLIVGVAVPEPSMLVLAGLGMGCVLTGCASLQRQR